MAPPSPPPKKGGRANQRSQTPTAIPRARTNLMIRSPARMGVTVDNVAEQVTTTTTTTTTTTGTGTGKPTGRSAPPRARTERKLQVVARRRSTGPLSEAIMSTIRCPTRADFLHAVNGLTPPSEHASARALARSLSSLSSRARRARARAPRVVLRTSRLTDDGAGAVGGEGDDEDAEADAEEEEEEEEEEEATVPAYLNERVLDAMDRIAECEELRAIMQWTDAVRQENGIRTAITDVDLTNGVVLLQVLRVIAASTFERATGGEIRTELDAEGRAARENIASVRATLQQFAWRDGGDGAKLRAVPFDRVDVWGLSGFVVLAGVTGAVASSEVERMLGMEEWVQERLSDVVASGLDALGAGAGTRPGWLVERQRREGLEQEVCHLRQQVHVLLRERDELERELGAERLAAQHARTELRWLRLAVGRKKRVLGESNEARNEARVEDTAVREDDVVGGKRKERKERVGG